MTKPKIYNPKTYKEMSAETDLPIDETDPNIIKKINSLLKFFDETGIEYDKFKPESFEESRSNIFKNKKKAYPNTDYNTSLSKEHDTQKWLGTVKELYTKEKNGLNRIAAIRQATNGWKIVEIHDFLNWLKYYEQGTHLKYKMAQLWYENGSPGYFLHIKQDSKKEENTSVNGEDVDMARDTISNDISTSEKKHIIEKQRSKIIGRLDSAEKLLRTNDGQLFAGKELESLLESIYQLKKKVQMINKISTSTKLYDDMIVREANILNNRGFVKAANILYSLSQSKMAVTPSPNPPQQGSGSAGGLPSVGPGMAQNPPESAPSENTPSKGIEEFLENLDTSNIGIKEDNLHNEDVLEIQDNLNISDTDSDILITEAQNMGEPTLDAPRKVMKSTEAPLPQKNVVKKPVENELFDAKKPDEFSQKNRDFDNMIDAAFSNIKVADIVAKLEDLAKIFKTREIPRQLSIVDMMLDSLGLAAYFPSLSEATNKALESNNYISTRVDEILSRLQGSMESKEIDLMGENGPKFNSPELSSLRQNLQTQESKEKARKKMRKEQADQELEAPTSIKETPEIDIEEDLSKPIVPANEQTPAKIPPKPTTI